MDKIGSQLARHPKRLPLLVIGLGLLILAAVILLTTIHLRSKIRQQIVGRDGEILQAVALMQQSEAAEDLVGSIDDPANQLIIMLKTSRLKGVMGARLFSSEGKFLEAFPLHVRAADLAVDLYELRQLTAVSRFLSATRPAEVFWEESLTAEEASRPMPILEVNVPLQSASNSQLAGVAQFLIEGHSIAAEFAKLDQHLAWQGLLAFAVSGAVLAATLLWALGRLQKAQTLLSQRTNNLLRANQELALAAKTSAVGAITAHLIHGLKNPLSGLQNFVSSLNMSEAALPEAEWQEAVTSTRRMQKMINEIVNVLREEEQTSQYELTLAEFAELVSSRAVLVARDKGVHFQVHLKGDAVLSNRVANLVRLILLNIVQNAIEATPAGDSVELVLNGLGQELVCEVSDHGPGFPAGKNLFAPCQSSKEGGSGVGLAISKQLANHLGAELEMKTNSAAGCVFCLRLPAESFFENESVRVPL